MGVYKQCTERLKVVKAEIDRLKAASEQNKDRLQKDFEAWYLSLQASQLARENVGVDQTLSSTQLPRSHALAPESKQQEVKASPKSSASAPESKPQEVRT